MVHGARRLLITQKSPKLLIVARFKVWGGLFKRVIALRGLGDSLMLRSKLDADGSFHEEVVRGKSNMWFSLTREYGRKPSSGGNSEVQSVKFAGVGGYRMEYL